MDLINKIVGSLADRKDESFLVFKRGFVWLTLENALSICNNISRGNYTRASSQSAAQYFRIIRSS